MPRNPLVPIISCILLLAFTACNKVPDHAKYIPKDAVVVIGINARQIGKKIAWNAITGSKLFKQWMHDLHEKSSGDLEFGKLGIDGLNTFYVYIKNDKRFKDGTKVTALIPLNSSADWETYITKQLPNIHISAHGNLKVAMLNEGMYAGWNNKLLVVMNMLPGTDQLMGNTPNANQAQLDENALATEINVVLGTTKENALIENQRFNTLQKEEHDVLFWMNYDILMSQLMAEGLADKMEGVSLTNTLWKNSAFAGGIDFDKGAIHGKARYYVSDAMLESSKEMGSLNIDKDIVERLPLKNPDLLMALRFAPKGLNSMMEKSGLLGLANMALSQQNMNAAYVLDAFTGDMAMVLNNLEMHNETVVDTMFGERTESTSLKTKANALYVVKINKKENFNKLFDLYVKENLLPLSNNLWAIPVTESDSVFICLTDTYAIAGNKRADIDNFIAGTNKNQKSSPDAGDIKAGSFTLFIDIKQMANTITPIVSHSAHDSAVYEQSKKLLDNILINAGSFKDNAYEYHMTINFINRDENSLINIMDFGMKINDINNAGQKLSAFNTKNYQKNN